MKVDDIVRYRGPQLTPLASDGADLGFLVPALVRAGYTYDNLSALFGSAWMAFNELPGYVWKCRHDDRPLARLALLFLLAEEVERARVEEDLGEEGVRRLLDREMLEVRGDRLAARVDLYECLGVVVFTDHNLGVVRFTKHVYEPGADSYTCARTTPRPSADRPRRILDLCTGAGLHALLAAASADEVVGVDVNPRALAFAQVNAAVNGVRDRVRFLKGDLYDALPAEEAPFDQIVSNPPWIATPDEKMQLYRWGGETGETLTGRIVEGLPRHLAPGGRLSMFVIYPVMRSTAYLERLKAWLGGGEGWGISLVTFTMMPLSAFIATHMAGKWEWAEHVAELNRYMDMYDRHGIECMASGMVYVTRMAEGKGWAVERAMPLPLADMRAPIERWLDALALLHGGNAPPPSRLSEEVAHFGVDPRDGSGRVEWIPGWGATERLSPGEVRQVLAVLCGEDPGDTFDLRVRRVVE
jgi:carbamoyltransferase